MRTRQKVVVVLLVCLSLLQQGVRWRLGTGDLTPENRISQVALAAAAESVASAKHCELVHINSAGMAELQTLPGVGPVYAERIISMRREQLFQEKTDLLQVKGIGEKRLAQIVDLICLYVGDDESK